MQQARLSSQAVEPLRRELPALLEAVNERLAVDASFHCGGMSCDRLALSREYNEQFGRVLLAVSDFGLSDRLAHEFSWLVGVLSRRGFLPEHFGRMLEAWSMATVTQLGPAEAGELLPLLDRLRQNLGLSFEAQRHDVTHDPRVFPYADRLVKMEDGAIVYDSRLAAEGGRQDA
ncbi:hypothetical protein FJY69_05105 [candidate division WOR-3 bacterium]|nr:hypothetical protein [candidate division WOR-3 bacterium]